MTANENTDDRRTDFRQHVPLGRTGLMVSRLGIASGNGVPAGSIEKAFHEYGLNFFYLSFPWRRQVKKALRNLMPGHREKSVIVLPHFSINGGMFLRRSAGSISTPSISSSYRM